MSVSNSFYETTSFFTTIPALPQIRELHQENFNEEWGQFGKVVASQNTPKLNEGSIDRLDSRQGTRSSKSSCLYGLTSGIAASFLLKNPLPTLMGLGACFPRAYAQQKIGNEFKVNTYTNNSQGRSSVASFSNGNFVVTWHSYGQDGSSDGVYGQLFDGNGTKIGGEFQANTYTNSSQTNPSVASFSNGNFVVTWTSYRQDDSFGGGVYGQLFNGNGTEIGGEFQANTYTTHQQREPSVASISNGNFVVTWQSYNQGGFFNGIYGQLFDGSGPKIRGEFQANTDIFFDQVDSSVASFDNGNFVVTWMSNRQDGDGWGIYGQLFDGNATRIGNEFQVNTYTADYQRKPSVASLAGGNFVVTWDSQDQDGSGYGVFGQLFDGNGIKIGSEFRANSYTTSDQLYPSVASFPNGNFVVTWQSWGQDSLLLGIYGQLFDGIGTKIGIEFRANTYVTLDQSTPSVASLANGNFVVTWSSMWQDGDLGGIFGQIFDDFPVSSTTRTTTSSTTSSSRSSTTKTTTSFTTSSVSSSTLSTTSSTAYSSSTMRPITTSNSRITLFATSNPRNFFSWIWFLLGGTGAVSCLGLTVYFIFKSRNGKNEGSGHACELGEVGQTGARFSEETGIFSTRAIDLEPVVQRHKVIGEAYLQLSTLVREEAEEIYLQTGHLIPFPEGQKKYKYVIGRGQFGQIKVAQHIVDNQYVVSKKVKGAENMSESEAEAQMQKDAAGANVLPIYNTIRLPDALYHFMPLAGLGDGIAIQRRLAILNQSPLVLTILTFIAQNVLTGLQTIHAKRIFHLDMKPDNLVFSNDGTAYITDFGCAKRLTDTCLPGGVLGDNRYFSPERLQSCLEGTFDAENADMWAAGVTLLQIFYNKEPLELLNMPHRLAARVERCNRAHFDEQLQRFSEVERGSIWWVIKGLLDTNPKTRLTATQALQASCFHGVDKTQQRQAFEELRRETFAQYQGIKTSQVDLRDYGWIVSRAPEEERAQEYRSANYRQFYGYSLTPDLHQLTPVHVSAGSSSSGYQLTP